MLEADWVQQFELDLQKAERALQQQRDIDAAFRGFEVMWQTGASNEWSTTQAKEAADTWPNAGGALLMISAKETADQTG